MFNCFCRNCRTKHRGIVPSATNAVAKAIKNGTLPKLDGSVFCIDCGKSAEVYDHRDYNKPLDVDPVCKKCNSLRGEGKNKPDLPCLGFISARQYHHPVHSPEKALHVVDYSLGCRCRCGHEWLPRIKGDHPLVCPACKSPRWDKPKLEGPGRPKGKKV